MTKSTPERADTEEIVCPFCKQDNFDLIGLKEHYRMDYCEVLNSTISPEEERAQRILDNLERAKLKGDL